MNVDLVPGGALGLTSSVNVSRSRELGPIKTIAWSACPRGDRWLLSRCSKSQRAVHFRGVYPAPKSFTAKARSG